MTVAGFWLAAVLVGGSGSGDASSAEAEPTRPRAVEEQDAEVVADLELLLNLDLATELEMLRELAGDDEEPGRAPLAR